MKGGQHTLRVLLLSVVLLGDALLVSGATPKVMVEIEFDIAATKEEGPPGQNVGQILTSFLHDPSLDWMRYLNTLVDGTPGPTPSRCAWMEFRDLNEWTAFEKKQKGPTHVLFDLYWINWRRMPWFSDEEREVSVEYTTKREEGHEGFVVTVKYTPEEGKEQQLANLHRNELESKVSMMAETGGLLHRWAYKTAFCSSELTHLVVYEFDSLHNLMDALYTKNLILEADPAAQKFYKLYGTAVYQPPYENGGNILWGVNRRKDDV